jgi:hypothetical protein
LGALLLESFRASIRDARERSGEEMALV